MMLHAFVGYLRALWAECWDYDQFETAYLDVHRKAYSVYCREGTDAQCKGYALGLDDEFEMFELAEADWAVSHSSSVTVRSLWDPTERGVVYELEPFYSNSGLDKWCADRRDSEWFIESLSAEQIAQSRLNPTIAHSLAVWSRLEEAEAQNAQKFQSESESEMEEISDDAAQTQTQRQSIAQSAMFDIVASETCDFSRLTSLNSCYSEGMHSDVSDSALCSADVSDSELDALDLEDLVSMDGVRDSECLTQIRRDVFEHARHFPSVKRMLCRGELDYVCPERPEVDGFDLDVLLGKKGEESGEEWKWKAVVVGFAMLCLMWAVLRCLVRAQSDSEYQSIK